MPPPLPELADDLLGEAFLRLPPDDPACLLRASLVCKRWRRILADPAFRRRHRELHRTPSVLGFLWNSGHDASFVVPNNNPASGRPAARDLPGWLQLGCRHGRALFVTQATHQEPRRRRRRGYALDFVVWDPLTDERHLLPSPPPSFAKNSFNAAVLCAAASGSCDHRGCHGGPFRVAFIFSTWVDNIGVVTSASLYSSETGVWSRLTSVQHPDVQVCSFSHGYTSALVGDTLYFRTHQKYVFEYQLGAQSLSLIDLLPEHLPQFYMSSVDDKLCLFNVEKQPRFCLCLWSQEIDPNGVAQWARGRVIKLEGLLPSEALLPQPNHPSGLKYPCIIGFAEGTDVILLVVPTHEFGCHVYMAELNSGRAKKIHEGLSLVYPYTSFSIPVIGSGSTGEGPDKGASSV